VLEVHFKIFPVNYA